MDLWIWSEYQFTLLNVLGVGGRVGCNLSSPLLGMSPISHKIYFLQRTMGSVSWTSAMVSVCIASATGLHYSVNKTKINNGMAVWECRGGNRVNSCMWTLTLTALLQIPAVCRVLPNVKCDQRPAKYKPHVWEARKAYQSTPCHRGKREYNSSSSATLQRSSYSICKNDTCFGSKPIKNGILRSRCAWAGV